MAEEMFTAPELSEQEQIRRAKLFKYQAEGRDPYTITRYDRTHTSRQILEGFEALEGQEVSIAGRMMSRRIMGKASFVHMLDGEGQSLLAETALAVAASAGSAAMADAGGDRGKA